MVGIMRGCRLDFWVWFWGGFDDLRKDAMITIQRRSDLALQKEVFCSVRRGDRVMDSCEAIRSGD